MSRDPKLKMKEIGELVANLLCLDKLQAFLKEDQHTQLSTFGMNVHEVKIKVLNNPKLNLGI